MKKHDMRMLIRAGSVVTAKGVPECRLLVIDEGWISDVLSGAVGEPADRIIDADQMATYPGLIDIHIHGAVGIDVNTADAEGLLEVAAFLARNGVTAWVPTVVPDSDESYRRIIGEVDRLMEIQEGRPVAQALGVHYEGVFANRKMCGALRPEYFKAFTGGSHHPVSRSGCHPSSGRRGAELDLPVPRRGVKMMTFAPEIEGGVELARELTKRGWIASIGHTSASSETLDRAFEAGARHLTHFFNAMSGIHHREMGVAGWGLANEDATFDIIADGVHVDPRMLGFAVGCKTPDKVTLISDSVAPTGLGDGEFEIWGEKISVRDGRTQNERGSIAGSVITMLDAVRRMLSLGFSRADVAKMASLNPARLLGVEGSRGSIEIGKRADLVGIDQAGNVRLTIIGGNVAYESEPPA